MWLTICNELIIFESYIVIVENKRNNTKQRKFIVISKNYISEETLHTTSLVTCHMLSYQDLLYSKIGKFLNVNGVSVSSRVEIRLGQQYVSRLGRVKRIPKEILGPVTARLLQG